LLVLRDRIWTQRVLINSPYALEGVAKALMDLESRRSTGRLLLSIGT
jgi:hypothetical protein